MRVRVRARDSVAGLRRSAPWCAVRVRKVRVPGARSSAPKYEAKVAISHYKPLYTAISRTAAGVRASEKFVTRKAAHRSTLPPFTAYTPGHKQVNVNLELSKAPARRQLKAFIFFLTAPNAESARHTSNTTMQLIAASCCFLQLIASARLIAASSRCEGPAQLQTRAAGQTSQQEDATASLSGARRGRRPRRGTATSDRLFSRRLITNWRGAPRRNGQNRRDKAC